MLNIIGIYSGIGPNLYPAKLKGWNILANFEPRDGFQSGTWQLNFDGTPQYKDWNHIGDYVDKADILVAFPTCRFFSQAGFQWLTPEQRAKKRASFEELEKCRKVIALLKPKIFLIENVQPLLKYYEFKQDGYNIRLLKIINRDYGNCQIRKRLWIIGTNGKIKFDFVPLIFVKQATLRDRIGDLPFTEDMPEIQHIHKKPDDKPSWVLKSIYNDEKLDTQEKLAKYVLTFAPKKCVEYRNKDGVIKPKIRYVRGCWDSTQPVIGVDEGKFHPTTGYPLTIRERARILGFPDSFLFTGPYKDQLVQTGACIPLEFPTYLYDLIEDQNK